MAERVIVFGYTMPGRHSVQFFATAKLSAAGHIIFSKEAREHMKMHKDDEFLVLGGGSFIVLTAVPRDALRQLDGWARAARDWVARAARDGQGVARATAKRAAAAAGVRVRRRPAKGSRSRTRVTAH